MSAYEGLDAAGLRNAILKGERSVRTTILEAFERIDALDDKLHLWS